MSTYYLNTGCSNQGIGTHFTSLRLVMDNVLEERPKLVNKFNSQLQKDITALNEKISEIRDEITVKQHILGIVLICAECSISLYSNPGYWITTATTRLV